MPPVRGVGEERNITSLAEAAAHAAGPSVSTHSALTTGSSVGPPRTYTFISTRLVPVHSEIRCANYLTSPRRRPRVAIRRTTGVRP